MGWPLFRNGKILLCGSKLALSCCSRIAEITLTLSGNSGVYTAYLLRYGNITWGYNYTNGATADVWDDGVLWGTPLSSGSFTAKFDMDVLVAPVTIQVLAETHFSRQGDNPGTVGISVSYLGRITSSTLSPSPIYTEQQDASSGWTPQQGPTASAAAKSIRITSSGVDFP